MNDFHALNDNDLDDVTGGTGSGTVPSSPTGGVTYKCPICGCTISASTRDVTVTCPRVSCRSKFRVEKGKLVGISSSL